MTDHGVNPSSRVLVIGGGYTGQRFAAAARAQGAQVWLTSRSAQEEPHWLRFNAGEGAIPELPEALSHVLITLPPNGDGEDDAYNVLRASLEPQPLDWVGYLSTTGVYGDTQGQWADEGSPTQPGLRRSQSRLQCEQRWLASALPLQSFRLPAIYGPGRCPFQQLKQGTARLIHKPQQGQIDAGDVVETLVRRPDDQLSLGMVVNRAGERPLDWGKRPDHFSGNRPAKRERKCKVWNGQEKGVKAKNRPKTWGASNDHIGESVAVWFEGDGALPVEEQERFHELIGLPAPTFTVWTGSKSLHNYYVLDVPCSPEKSHFLMDWIGTALKRANPEAGADESLKNPCRVMRVPGGKHGKTGGRAYIYSEHPLRRRFTVAELEAALPAEDRPEKRSRIRDLKWKNSKASRENWWTRLSPEEQWDEAVLMMSVIPPRLKPSADGGPVGTRKPALTVLGGLADEFGPEDAVAICIEAQWFNEWWDPAVEVENFDPVHLTFWTVVKHATKHGYLKPQDRRLKALKEEANKGHSSDPPLQGEWAETFDWMLTEEISCEVLIEKALKAEAEKTGSEWLCHQERFRRYLPDQGYYESVSFTELKKHVSELLRRVYEAVGGQRRRHVGGHHGHSQSDGRCGFSGLPQWHPAPDC